MGNGGNFLAVLEFNVFPQPASHGGEGRHIPGLSLPRFLPPDELKLLPGLSLGVAASSMTNRTLQFNWFTYSGVPLDVEQNDYV